MMLNLHLGDEKKKVQNLVRVQSSQKTLNHNPSSSSIILKKGPESLPDQSTPLSGAIHNKALDETPPRHPFQLEESILQQLRDENSALTKENATLKKQAQRNGEELKRLEDAKAKEKSRYEAHIGKLENYIEELKRDIRKHQEEVEKAIKIHRANEQLLQKNEQLKTYSERLNQEIESLRAERAKDDGKYQQLLKHAQVLSKSPQTSQRDDGPCRNCLQTIDDKERVIVEMEELKRQLAQARREPSGAQEVQPATRKSSHTSVASELKKHHNPVEDLIIQKSNQLQIQQLEQSHRQQLATLQQELDSKVRTNKLILIRLSSYQTSNALQRNTNQENAPSSLSSSICAPSSQKPKPRPRVLST